MADFSFLSDDSDNEKAVEELLSQAMDQSVLEQVAAINCSGFTDSVLPTQLETRFRKLKSLSTRPTTLKPSNVTRNSSSFCFSEFPNTPKTKKIGNPDEENDLEDGFVQENTKSIENDVFLKTLKTKKIGNPVEEKGLEDGFVQEQKKSMENDVFLKTPDGKRGKTKTGCFWCSLKKGSNKKGKENRGVKWGKDDDDDVLSDLSIFSSKNQEKLMKKAMEEQEKINREAEKIVKWAKQASARMDVSSIEDELSDDDIFK
ncbi:hypothetical protein RND71_042615 [Anisodus tanguticus]|uniref:Uncharacterized protein n=1 Tax=Anisodus tanguticus TaxID=243964 RepID=A0AAE1QR69_9SOLA|nr:hypothetical protein RND71_042615 [Anisodus tanguticus]